MSSWIHELWQYFPWQYIVGGTFCFIGGALCSGSGAGGGGFYIPVFIFILGYDPHLAIPLSKSTIFGIALGSYLMLYSRRHPTRERPLIDYHMANYLEPWTIVGSIIGVFLNIWSPSWLVLAFLGLVVCYSGYRVFFKAWKSVLQEEPALIAYLSTLTRRFSPSVPPSTAPPEVFDILQVKADHSHLRADEWEHLEQILVDEGDTFPLHPLAWLAICWSGSIAFLYAKSLFPCGSTVFYGLIIGSLVFAISVGLYTSYATAQSYHERQRLDYPFAEGDVHYAWRGLVLYPLGGALAGVAAAYIGIGGGMVKTPLMLDMGMVPQVVTATSSFMILFTSASSTLQYYYMGKFDDFFHPLFYCLVGFAASICGQWLVKKMVEKYRKQWMVSALLGFVLIISALLLFSVFIRQLLAGFDPPRSLCT